jgi:hypothetical protein
MPRQQHLDPDATLATLAGMASSRFGDGRSGQGARPLRPRAVVHDADARRRGS